MRAQCLGKTRTRAIFLDSQVSTVDISKGVGWLSYSKESPNSGTPEWLSVLCPFISNNTTQKFIVIGFSSMLSHFSQVQYAFSVAISLKVISNRGIAAN
jgi:hypothetical protein